MKKNLGFIVFNQLDKILDNVYYVKYNHYYELKMIFSYISVLLNPTFNSKLIKSSLTIRSNRNLTF